MNPLDPIDPQKLHFYNNLQRWESIIHQELYPQLFLEDFDRKSLLSKKSCAHLTPETRKLAEKLHKMILSRFRKLSMDKRAAGILKEKRLLIPIKVLDQLKKESETIKSTYPVAWKETFETVKIKRRIREFVEMFNEEFYNLDKYRKQALDILQEIKSHSWEFTRGIPTVPKASAIPAARVGLFQLFRCNDLQIKEEALHALTELMEWDPLQMESAFHLVELQNGLLEEIRAAKAQNLNTTLQRKLIKAYAISIECFLLHAGAGHLNAMADDTKQENWSGAEEMEGLNISEDPEIKFWAKYAIQGIQYIKSDKSTLKGIIERLGKIVHAGILIGIAVANPSDASGLVTDIFNDLMESIHHIQWRKEWFHELLILKKLCRYTTIEPSQFRQLSTILRNKKKGQTNEALLYGTVTLIENVLMNSPSKEIQEEGLKLLLDYFTIVHVPIRKRVVLAFEHLTTSENLTLNNTAFGILRMLSAVEMMPERLNLPQRQISRGFLYENVLKFLLLRLAEIKSGLDISGHSLITLLCKSQERKIVSPLLRCLAELCPEFQGPDPSGNTGFHVMIRQGYVSSTDYITPKMREFVDYQENEQLYTALHDAVLMESVEGTSFLIRLEANKDLQDRRGNTPLHYAAELKDNKIAELLITGGANLNLLNQEGKTVLNIALEMNNEKIVLLLLKHRGKIAEEAQGITPIMLAAKVKNCTMLQALIKHAEGKISEDEALEIAKLGNCTGTLQKRKNPFWVLHAELKSKNIAYQQAFKNLDRERFRRYRRGETKVTAALREKQSTTTLRRLLEEESANIADPGGRTALHAAVLYRNREAIEILQEYGADINEQDMEGNTPLHLAAFNRDHKTIRQLLKGGADPTIKNNAGDTPFLMACGTPSTRIPHNAPNLKSDEVRSLRRLIRKGSASDAKDALGNNALHRAAMSGSSTLILYLIRKYPEMLWEKNQLGNLAIERILTIDPNLVFEECKTNGLLELHNKLLQCSDHCLSLGNLLVEANETLLFQKFIEEDRSMAAFCFGSRNQHTPLHTAAISGNCDILKIYLEEGFNLDQTDAMGNTAAHLAAFYKQEDFLTLLKENGYQFLLKNRDNRTPLHLAAGGQNANVIRATFNENNAGEIDSRGDTALHIAARKGDETILKIFYPTTTTLNDDGNSPLHIACMHGNLDGVPFLIQKGEKVELKNAFGQTPILLAAQEGFMPVVSFLRNIGTNIWATDEERESLLHKAVFNHHKDVVIGILQEEKSLIPPTIGGLARQDDRQGEIPLHELPKIAPKGNDPTQEILRALLNAGADPRTANQQGETFLHVVSYYGRLELLRTLLRKKRKISLIPRDAYNNTPLHRAVEGNQPDIVRELCRRTRKTGTNKKNDEGLTPLLLAVKKGFWLCARILLSHHAKAGSRSKADKTLFHLILDRPVLDSEGSVFLFDAVNSFPKLFLAQDDEGQTALHMIAMHNHELLTFPLRFLPGRRRKKREKFMRIQNADNLTAVELAENKQHAHLALKLRTFASDFLGADYRHRTKALKPRPFKEKP